MKLILHFVAAAISLPALLFNSAVAQEPPAMTKIGIYESRAVALAYGRSTQHNLTVSNLIASAKKSKADGDDAKYRRLQQQLEDHQHQLEYQVFSDRRIDDILKQIEPSLKDVKLQASVDRIVDKRDVPTNSVTVDVTRQLVDQFHPAEKTLKMIDDLLKHPPVKQVPKH